MKRHCWLVFLALLLLAGCIKDELPNIEADITEVRYADDSGVLNVVFHAAGIDIYADAAQVNLSDITFDYVVSEGAVIQPDPATVHDYSVPRLFTVTSEDGAWTREYAVKVLFPAMPTRYGFENWLIPEKKKYSVPYEEYPVGGANEKLHIWACGNGAYSFVVSHDGDYRAFPTQYTEEAHGGRYAAKLMTMNTGQIDRPVAAGNLFIGQFDESRRAPLESTMFGLPFTRKPLRFKGWYRYKSGGLTFKTSQPDCCKMQAVLYRTDAQVKHLNGHTIKNSPNIVARAELPESEGHGTGGAYVPFDIEFNYVAPVDPDVMQHGGYNLAVIFSSSRNGDVYDGAVGSVLYVDDVEIVCEQ